MSYAIVAKPTNYAGTRFGSRLEARWAAFFDLGNVHWEYEPFDCAGYVPDFVLYGASGNVIVEVKPSPLWAASATQFAAGFKAGADLNYQFVVLPETIEDGSPGAIVGRAYVAADFWVSAWLRVQSGEPPRIDLTTLRGGATALSGTPGYPVPFDAAVALWREAGNRVQWHASEAA